MCLLFLLATVSIICARFGKSQTPCTEVCFGPGNQRATVTFPNTFQNVPKHMETFNLPFHPTIFDPDIEGIFVTPGASFGERDLNLKKLTFLTLGDGSVGTSVRTIGNRWFQGTNTNRVTDPGTGDSEDLLDLDLRGFGEPDQVCCVKDDRIVQMLGNANLNRVVFTSLQNSGTLRASDADALNWGVGGQATTSWRLFPETQFARTETVAVRKRDLRRGGGSTRTAGKNWFSSWFSASPNNQPDDVELLAFTNTLLTKLEPPTSASSTSASAPSGPRLYGNNYPPTYIPVKPESMIPPEASILLHSYKVVHSKRRERKGEMDAVVIQNSVTKEFLAVDVDSSFGVRSSSTISLYQNYHYKSYPVSLPVFLSESVFNAEQSNLGSGLAYFQNSKLSKIKAPDQRFFVKRFLSKNSGEYLLCSLYHRDTCLFADKANHLVLVSIGSVANLKDGAPNLSDLKDKDFTDFNNRVTNAKLGSLATFEALGTNRIRSLLDNLQLSGNNLLNRITSTACQLFLHCKQSG